MDNIESIIKKNKAKRLSYVPSSSSNELSPKLKYFKNLISRSLIAVIFVLGSIIYTNVSETNKELYQSYILEDSLSFTKINNWYQKYFGTVDIIKPSTEEATRVFFNSIQYSELEAYKNGVKLTIGLNQAVNVITSGIVVYIGEKEDLGNTIIIQGNDGVDIWYSNITDTDIQMYDYVEAGSIIGTSNNDYIYLTINKDGKYISYEEYQALI